MRALILFLSLIFFSFAPDTMLSQNAKIVIKKNRSATVDEVFELIKQQTDYRFIYRSDMFENVPKVQLEKGVLNVKTLLEMTLSKGNFQFEESANNTIIINEPSKSISSNKVFEPIKIKGKVVDSKGMPVPAVNVMIKETKKVVVTDFDGSFTISAEKGQTLVFTFVGYKSQSVKIETAKELNIILAEEVSELNAVVLTGYYSQSKDRAAGSFAKPDMDIVQERSYSMNVLQRMDGLVAGLTINNAPSSSQNPFLIRGLSSIGVQDPNDPTSYIGTNRNPLIVIDGVAYDDVSFVNPQDVQDITVLKDASAASIWGARASNGVIVITTKKGKNSQKLKVRYDGFTSFQGKPDLNYLPVLNSQQFIQAAKDVFDPVSYPYSQVSAFTGTAGKGISPHEQILYDQNRGLISEGQANARLDSLGSINNVRQMGDLFYRNAMLTNHTISLSAGGDKHSFYGSISTTNEQNSSPGDKNNSYKINLRQDFKFNDNINMYLITDLTNNVLSSKRPLDIDSRFLPYQLFRDASGNNISMPYMGILSEENRLDYEQRSRISLDYNPLNELDYGYSKTNSLLNRIIGGVNINIFKNLKFEGVYGFIKGYNDSKIYDDTQSYAVRSQVVEFTVAPTVGSTPVYYLPAEGGRYSVENLNQQNWTIRNQLTFNKSWLDDKHNLTILAGHESQERTVGTNRSTVRGYNQELLTYGSVDYATLENTGVFNPVMPNEFGRSILRNDSFNETESISRFESFYSNGSYMFNKKYALNGSFRIDQSNLFGIDKSAQNRPVWSVGGKWIMSNESFIGQSSLLGNLALRATYGITGNSPLPGIASSSDIYQPVRGTFLPGGVGLSLATPANRKLTWESTENINIGIDFSMFNGRLNGAVDVYRKKTQDLLGELPTNAFAGYSSVIGNYGDMENRGIELTLNSTNYRNNNFSWSTIFTMAYNKNEITSLNNMNPITTGAQRIGQSFAEGYSAFAVFAYRNAGLDAVGDPLVYLADGSTTKDRNVTTPDDVVYNGTYQPVWAGGLSNTFTYKDFGLSVNAIYNLGHVMRRDVNQFYTGRLNGQSALYGGFTTGNVNSEFDSRWRNPGDEATTNIPSFVSNSAISDSRRDVSYYTLSDINVLDASYIKLRDITLSYNLPSILMKSIGADAISLRLQMSNIMLWKANDAGIDPEFQYANYGVRNLKTNQESLTLGANISF
ncbi:SusC/RagA family TonB-linked outer membrane protein [Flavobacterium sp. LC2016-12]|uniref:SusC/RagA family TonB-linked outer membrane protein n=1 Tax=Flavobacterium sp. LC2016-12 TaxID=2783794 RepID=UPI00188BA0D5|nr:SusC/RagA family TonB-linked outer membrane protein [Flavobacterium sp. LC2016-12]MBF4464981.1 SusC/RagA family TonB-linked outer membrane protein [Flavobacterium sp. LC2016-12]